jgi:hypothetical protein
MLDEQVLAELRSIKGLLAIIAMQQVKAGGGPPELHAQLTQNIIDLLGDEAPRSTPWPHHVG